MATAWFARGDAADQRRLANLAALAGVNWVRDRLSWREIQPAADRFADENTTYDSAATIQAEAGLKVLQVFHDTPGWAADGREGRGRFPDDLRHAYRLARAMAERFARPRAGVGAVERGERGQFRRAHGRRDVLVPEGGVPGLQGGRPRAGGLLERGHRHAHRVAHPGRVGQRGLALLRRLLDAHVRLARLVRESSGGRSTQAACGRPLWITEADRGINTSTGLPWCDLSPEDELRKARLMAQEYASSLAAGANRHFHFILGHYHEQGGKVQFGLLRMDKTPRPNYVALAALGRLLAGGRCLGTWPIEGQPHAHVSAFSARPDGRRAGRARGLGRTARRLAGAGQDDRPLVAAGGGLGRGGVRLSRPIARQGRARRASRRAGLRAACGRATPKSCRLRPCRRAPTARAKPRRSCCR